jgi:hypothetical protein
MGNKLEKIRLSLKAMTYRGEGEKLRASKTNSSVDKG